jgi:hypothetical protein
MPNIAGDHEDRPDVPLITLGSMSCHLTEHEHTHMKISKERKATIGFPLLSILLE